MFNKIKEFFVGKPVVAEAPYKVETVVAEVAPVVVAEVAPVVVAEATPAKAPRKPRAPKAEKAPRVVKPKAPAKKPVAKLKKA